MDATAADAWTRLETALEPLVPALPDDLAPPASDASLDALEARAGLDARAALSALYGRHDGQTGGAPGLFVGLRFLPATEAADEWTRWTDMIRDDPSLLADITVTSQPGGAVQPVYFSDAWIPIAADGAGNGLAVDLAPGPDGTAGQIISFGADEPVRTVVAPSAAALIAWLADAVESGRVTAVAEPDTPGGQVLALGAATSLLDALPDVLGPA